MFQVFLIWHVLQALAKASTLVLGEGLGEDAPELPAQGADAGAGGNVIPTQDKVPPPKFSLGTVQAGEANEGHEDKTTGHDAQTEGVIMESKPSGLYFDPLLAADKLAKQLPPELASQAQSIVQALQRAATSELEAGDTTSKALAARMLLEEAPKPASLQLQAPVPTTTLQVQAPVPPSTTQVQAPASTIQVQTPPSTTQVQAPPSTAEVQAAVPPTQVQAPAASAMQASDSEGNEGKTKRKKSPHELAAHAAWMRMHRQLRSGAPLE